MQKAAADAIAQRLQSLALQSSNQYAGLPYIRYAPSCTRPQIATRLSRKVLKKLGSGQGKLLRIYTALHRASGLFLPGCGAWCSLHQAAQPPSHRQPSEPSMLAHPPCSQVSAGTLLGAKSKNLEVNPRPRLCWYVQRYQSLSKMSRMGFSFSEPQHDNGFRRVCKPACKKKRSTVTLALSVGYRQHAIHICYIAFTA